MSYPCRIKVLVQFSVIFDITNTAVILTLLFLFTDFSFESLFEGLLGDDIAKLFLDILVNTLSFVDLTGKSSDAKI